MLYKERVRWMRKLITAPYQEFITFPVELWTNRLPAKTVEYIFRQRAKKDGVNYFAWNEDFNELPQIDLDLPNGKIGEWWIDDNEVSIPHANVFNKQHVDAKTRPGKYKRLNKGNTLIFSNAPMEVRDHSELFRMATGHVLLSGLGLGMALSVLLKMDDVTKVTVIEQSAEVIQLVGRYYDDPRVDIIHADAFAWSPPEGFSCDVAWHDIWPRVTMQTYSEIKALYGKYDSFCTWQGAWCEKQSQLVEMEDIETYYRPFLDDRENLIITLLTTTNMNKFGMITGRDDMINLF
jgi:hypothetical protein